MISTSPPQPVHLAPKSQSGRRIWSLGCGESAVTADVPGELWLQVHPDQHETFRSLRAILGQLKLFRSAGDVAEWNRLQKYLAEAIPESDLAVGDGGMLVDSVAYAIMRRISRESYYTSRVIELAALLINRLLSRQGWCCVHVPDIDRLDRPSLKVLARAMILLEDAHSFTWVWHSTSDPLTDTVEPSDMFVRSRAALLRQLIGILAPTIIHRGPVRGLVRPQGKIDQMSTYQISGALVVQNYDACFLWGGALLEGTDRVTRSEIFRLMALASVNIGELDQAIDYLIQAERGAAGPARRAHLAYLKGLLASKRHYDLAAAEAYYRQGLTWLESPCEEGSDPSLERAWLMNGLALIESLRWRGQHKQQRHSEQAFALELDAFELVRDGNHPARYYLRYNLLANAAFLMEMQGQFDVALEIFQEAYDFGLQKAQSSEDRWKSTLGYRVGVLHYRAGRFEQAEAFLRAALDREWLAENWAHQERLLYALGRVSLQRKAYRQASSLFDQGLKICLRVRAARGARDHGRGRAVALSRQGKIRAANSFCGRLSRQEGLALWPTGVVSADDLPLTEPSPKLPAYFPEIDLEDIPAVDLSRYLGGALPHDLTVTDLWSLPCGMS